MGAEDATVMTEDSDEPYLCGQVFYPVSRRQILLLNSLMKRQGIAPIAYLNAHPFGWPGFEVVRRHPEWYVKASFNTAVMEKYSNNETVRGNVYPSIHMNFETPSANGQTYLGLPHRTACCQREAVRLGGLSLRCGPLADEVFSDRQDRAGETHAAGGHREQSGRLLPGQPAQHRLDDLLPGRFLDDGGEHCFRFP